MRCFPGECGWEWEREFVTNKEEFQLVVTDLPIALYLNQQVTLDILAALDDGFSRFSTVQTTTSGKKSTEVSGEAQVGANLTLFGMKFGGRGSRQTGQAQSESTTGEIIHTPASLFARLRRDLRNRGLVTDLLEPSGLGWVRPSDFVEFEATLQRNQFLVQLSAFAELVPLMSAFEEPTMPKGSRQRKQGKTTNSTMLKQVNSLVEALTSGESRDLVSRIGDINVVITTEQEYFIDPTMNDVIDGTFRVFGKATRVIPKGGDENISLLRKAPLGQFKSLLPTIQEAMSQFSNELGYSGDSSTEIQGPAIQVIPIAIFS